MSHVAKASKGLCRRVDFKGLHPNLCVFGVSIFKGDASPINFHVNPSA